MAGEFRFELDAAALQDYLDGPDVEDYLDDVGDLKASSAAQLAPKDTGRGAASISHETGVDDEGAYTRIGYTADGFYMPWVELGNGSSTAQPHLRPALDQDV